MPRRPLPFAILLVAACCFLARPAAAASLDLDYALSTHGIDLLDTRMHAELTPLGYAITAHSRSVGLLGVLAPVDLTSVASGRFDGTGIVPNRFASSGRSGGVNRVTRIAYPSGDPVVQVLTPVEPDRDPVPPAETRGSVDTLSVMVGLSRRVAETGRCDGDFLIFDGRRLSRLDARSAGTEAVAGASGAAFSGQALRCDFSSLQLGGFLHGSSRARLRKPVHGTAWLAAPSPGAPVAAVKAVFEIPWIGAATLDLTHAAATP